MSTVYVGPIWWCPRQGSSPPKVLWSWRRLCWATGPWAHVFLQPLAHSPSACEEEGWNNDITLCPFAVLVLSLLRQAANQPISQGFEGEMGSTAPSKQLNWGLQVQLVAIYSCQFHMALNANVKKYWGLLSNTFQYEIGNIFLCNKSLGTTSWGIMVNVLWDCLLKLFLNGKDPREAGMNSKHSKE